MTTAPDDTLELLDWASMPLVRGLVRLTGVGDTGTLVVPCNGSLPALAEQGCAGGELVTSYELVAFDTL